ncbi:MAG: hypothetical protein AAB359_00105, partial [Elusimicrobiota bacterium]
RVENITDATTVLDWTDAPIDLVPDLLTYPNYAIYDSTYTVGFSWTNNKIYRIRTRTAYDSASRVETPAAAEDDGIIVVLDQTNPTSKLTVPAHGVTYNSVTQLNGTAGDNLSGVDKIDISMADINQSTTYYWRWWTTSGTWITGEYFNAATMPSTYTWTYSNLPAWEDGKAYNIRTRAYDKAANSENLPAILKYTDAGQNYSKTFRYDISGPATTVSVPANDQIYGAMAKIEGNSTDLYSNVNIGSVELSLQRNVDSWYWDPAGGWSAGSAQWFTATSTYTEKSVNWYYDFSDIWHTTYTYTARARAKDYTVTGLNQGAGSAAAVFYVDKTNPDSIITFPTTLPRSSVNSITGTAADDRKMYLADTLQAAKIRIYRSVGGAYWNIGTSLWDEYPAAPEAYWSTTTFTFAGTAQSSGSFSFNSANVIWNSGYTYKVDSKAKDYVGNYQSSDYSVTFKFDNTNPESTIGYPADNIHYPVISTTSFTGTVVDPSNGSGVASVRVYVQDLTQGTTYWSGVAWTDLDSQKWLLVPLAAPTFGWNGADYGSPDWIDGNQYRIVSRASDQAANNEANGAGNAGTVRDSDFVYDVTKPTAVITYPYNGGYISQSGKITG